MGNGNNALSAVKAARKELQAAEVKAEQAKRSADRLNDAIEDFREDTARRLNPWRMVVTTAIGAFVAGISSLILFVSLAASCSAGEGGYCKLFAPENESMDEVVEALVSAQLRGTEYLLAGGTTEAFLSGEASATADLVVIISPDGDGTWTVESADASEATLRRLGLDFSGLPTPQEEVFGEDPDDLLVLEVARRVFDTKRPARVAQVTTSSGVVFTTNAVPHGPNTVALFTTIVQEQ